MPPARLEAGRDSLFSSFVGLLHPLQHALKNPKLDGYAVSHPNEWNVYPMRSASPQSGWGRKQHLSVQPPDSWKGYP